MPAAQVKLRAYLNSDRNPFHKPEVRAKSLLAQRKRGWVHLNGGNGRPIPVPQQLVSAALGWPTEYVVAVPAMTDGRPSHYKIDVAEPVLKVAVEIDGEGHKAKRVQDADRRKTAFLTEQGWTVLRFTNREVLTNLPQVLNTVMSSI